MKLFIGDLCYVFNNQEHYDKFIGEAHKQKNKINFDGKEVEYSVYDSIYDVAQMLVDDKVDWFKPEAKNKRDKIRKLAKKIEGKMETIVHINMNIDNMHIVAMFDKTFAGDGIYDCFLDVSIIDKNMTGMKSFPCSVDSGYLGYIALPNELQVDIEKLNKIGVVVDVDEFPDYSVEKHKKEFIHRFTWSDGRIATVR